MSKEKNKTSTEAAFPTECALLCCPSCGGECTVYISQSANPGDSWKKRIVGCNGIKNSDDEAEEVYIKNPCGLEISAYDDEREIGELIDQWQRLPRAT